MMRLWMTGFWLATVLPMAALLWWIRPALSERWRQVRPLSQLALAGLWLAGAGFLFSRTHDDVFAGLDVAAYRQMASAFVGGRNFHQEDDILKRVPEAVRPDFLFLPGPRPTRDLAFELFGVEEIDSKPFFMPSLPLASAAQGPALAPEFFVPLVGALWWALMLAAGFVAGGGWGVMAVAALALGTAWPAWFLRGFYAEGVGALLVSGVVAASSVRPLRGTFAGVAGLALGMAVTFHPTLVLLSLPVALALVLERRKIGAGLALAVGGVAGLFPFWALTRWVCQPYGDWTHWRVWSSRMMSIPVHRAIALALGALVVVSAVALCLGFRPKARGWIHRLDGWLTPWGWAFAALMPLVWIAGLPLLTENHALWDGALAVWSGIRWPYALLVLLGTVLVFRKDRPIRERFFLVALGWAAVPLLFIQGVEIPVGLWSQRRFLQIVLVGIGVLAAPMSFGLARISRTKWRALAVAGVLLAGSVNLVRWPLAYVTIQEQGAIEWTRSAADRMGTNRWVVFDYYPHGVPYAAGLKHRVLGLGERCHQRWPEAAQWLAKAAREDDVWLATSWSPSSLEQGARLEKVFEITGRFPRVRTKSFFPVELGERVVHNTFLRWVPLAEREGAIQDKVLDGSPIGLRGPWGRIKNGMTWTRQGSGIIGPIPEKGGIAEFEADCAWIPPIEDWTKQILLVMPPWGGEPIRVDVSIGTHRVRGMLMRPIDDEDRVLTGTYSLSVDHPYNPAAYGVRGYSNDLGVQIRQIIIRIEPRALSMSD